MSSQQDTSEYSEPVYTKSIDRAKFPFYHPNIEVKLVPQTRRLLEEYSHIPLEQQVQHVHRIRDLAWDIRAYPCTGIGAWLTPQLCKIPVYPEILTRVKNGETLMDVGCFVGHDFRRLVYDGAPSANLWGVDIASHWDVGFEMFRDREHFKAHFIEADILSENPAFEPLKGKVDILSALQIIHQWDWDGQIKAAKVLLTFTKPGSMVVGNGMGNPKAQEVSLKPLMVPMYRHSPESMEKFWNQVGSETGTKWETQAWMRTFEDMGWDSKDAAWMEPGVGMLEFAVKRIE